MCIIGEVLYRKMKLLLLEERNRDTKAADVYSRTQPPRVFFMVSVGKEPTKPLLLLHENLNFG